jgi:hypothetical protein
MSEKEMNIIEAMQAAESGRLITNNFIETSNCFLKYVSKGVFDQYQVINEQPMYKYQVHYFSMAEVISTGWKVLKTNPFKREIANIC